LNNEYTAQSSGILMEREETMKQLLSLESSLSASHDNNHNIDNQMNASPLVHHHKHLLPGDRAARRGSGIGYFYSTTTSNPPTDIHDARAFLDAGSDEERPTEDYGIMEAGSFQERVEKGYET
jgi:hypothetical protein